MRRQALVTMINAASSAGTSEEVYNSDSDFLSVQVSGTFSSGKIQVQAKTDVNASDWTNLAVIDKSTATAIEGSDGITAKGIYTVGIAGIVLVRVSVASVSGGNVTVVGSFENTSEK